MAANTSSAVMAQRTQAADDLDFFPTPGWGTRALCDHLLALDGATVWEPACGRGHMSRVLAEYAGRVAASDIGGYGAGEVFDFLSLEGLGLGVPPFGAVDWVVTNPPFVHLSRFLNVAVTVASRGVALLGRLQLLEGVDRWNSIYRPYDGHWTVAPFVERLPMEEGCVAPDTSSATAYAWLILDKARPRPSPLVYIPPCRRRLERPEDYDSPEFIARVRAAKEARKKGDIAA